MVRSGSAVPEILAAAQFCRADLIVAGTHGRTGLGRFLMGSVAEKLVRKSPVPVVTIRKAMGGDTPRRRVRCGPSWCRRTSPTAPSPPPAPPVRWPASWEPRSS